MLQRTAFFPAFMKPWGVRTPGLVADARKDLRVRPFPSAEWRPRGSRGTECGPEKCSSANQVNGAQIHPTVSFLSLACFPYLFFFFLFSFLRLLTTLQRDECKRPRSLTIIMSLDTSRVECSLRSRAWWRRFDERRVIAHPCMGELC